MEKALHWANPLHLPSIQADEGRVLDILYPAPIFQNVHPGKIIATLMGDKRHLGLLFPTSFRARRFLHPALNTLGVEHDQFETQIMEGVIKSTFFPPKIQSVFIIGLTDLFTYKYQSPEADFWQVARAYKTLHRSLDMLLHCSNSKILVLLPMALSGKNELDLVAAQGHALVHSVLRDTDFKGHIGTRIRFYSVPNFTCNSQARLGGFEKLYKLTRTGEYLLSPEGNKEVSYDMSQFIISWVQGQLPRVSLHLGTTEHELTKEVEGMKVLFPFRQTSSLAEAAERFDLQNINFLPTPPGAETQHNPRRGPQKDLVPRSNRAPPPLMSGSGSTTRHPAGKNLPGKKHHHQRSRPYNPGQKHTPWAQNY